jgi:hypothetical protein
MRGQRNKRAAANAQSVVGTALAVMDVSDYLPRRIPSAKWRELINPPSRKATADLRERCTKLIRSYARNVRTR